MNMPLTDPSSINAALKQFEHLTSFDAVTLERVARDADVREARPGTRLIELGSTDSRQLLLLDGDTPMNKRYRPTPPSKGHYNYLNYQNWIGNLVQLNSERGI